MLDRVRLGQVDVAADLDPPAGVVGIDDQHRRPRVAHQVLPLLSLERGVDEHIVALGRAPHRVRLRPGPEPRGERREQGALEEIAMRRGEGDLVGARSRCRWMSGGSPGRACGEALRACGDRDRVHASDQRVLGLGELGGHDLAEVRVRVRVRPSQLVEVGPRARFLELDVSADLDPPSSVRRLLQQERGPWTGAEVPCLLELSHRVHEQVVAIAAEPHDRGLEATVRHLGRHRDVQGTLQQIRVGRGDDRSVTRRDRSGRHGSDLIPFARIHPISSSSASLQMAPDDQFVMFPTISVWSSNHSALPPSATWVVAPVATFST